MSSVGLFLKLFQSPPSHAAGDEGRLQMRLPKVSPVLPGALTQPDALDGPFAHVDPGMSQRARGHRTVGQSTMGRRVHGHGGCRTPQVL